MGYHYKESGHGCWDILLTTKKGQEEGHLPKGVVVLTGFQYADPDYRNWMKEIESSGRYHVSVAKHCDDEDELMILSILVDTFISKISLTMQPGPKIDSISGA